MRKTRRQWIHDCEHKARHIVARQLATEAELAALKPRSAASSTEAWVFYWGHLCRILGREEARVSGLEHTHADALAIEALQAQPREVPLLTIGEQPGPRTVRVYPKGFDTLRGFFHVRDWLLTHLADRSEAIRMDGAPHDVELFTRVEAELSYQTRLVAWAACTPGPTLPFAYQDERPEIPEPWASLYPADVLRINEVFVAVNAGLLGALATLVAPGKAGGNRRASWSIFFGNLAMKVEIDAGRLMRDFSLAQLLATVRLSSPQPTEEELVGASA